MIFKIALRLRDRHVFMCQSKKVLNIFNTLTLKQIYWKTKTFSKKLEYRFLVETTKIEDTSFLFKTTLSEPMLRQIKWRLQNESITKSRVLSATTLFFWKTFSSFRTS